MKSKITKIIFSLIFIFSSTNFNFASDNTFIFKDIPKGHWAEQYIYRLKFLEVVKGDGYNTFGLNQNITRAQFVTMLVRLLGQDVPPDASSQNFDDVLSYYWAYPYIDKALKQGIIFREDYLYNTFRPRENITRQEMAVMCVRALKSNNLIKLAKDANAGFSDVSLFNSEIFVAKSYGIIKGITPDEFKPYNPALRQEAAAMMVRLMDILYQRDTYPITIKNQI